MTPTPTIVAFPRSNPSRWLEAEIHDRVKRLQSICSDIVSCRAVVDIPHRRHKKGNRFSLRLELAVPGEDLAITRDANLHGAVKDLVDEHSWSKRFDVEATRRDIRLVIGDAFDAAKRRLRDYAQRRRREVKRHGPPRRSVVASSSGPQVRQARRSRLEP